MSLLPEDDKLAILSGRHLESGCLALVDQVGVENVKLVTLHREKYFITFNL